MLASPSPDSIIASSKTPYASTPTLHQEILTPSSSDSTSKPDYLCEKVPEPELTPVTTSNTYLSGKFYLCTYDGTQIGFDFDGGKLGSKESVDTDIELLISGASIDNRSLYFLRETNDAYVAVSEIDIPTREYCQKQVTSATRLTLVLGSEGTAGCILTNQGRLAYFQVGRLDPFGLESVEVFFTTWNNK
jgi:hypothetical protein